MSQWCQFELTMAQTRLLELDRDNLILVLLEEIAEPNLSERLRLQLERRTYIEWPASSPTGQKLFWEKLILALSKPSASVNFLSLSETNSAFAVFASKSVKTD